MMKKKFLFTILISGIALLAKAQVGIGTTDPKSKLHVMGNLLVARSAMPATNATPTLAQTQTLVNATTITVSGNEDVWRIYDPGGALGNYVPNITAYADIQSAPSINLVGIKLSIGTIDLGTGDSLIIMDNSPANNGNVLMAVGNNYTTTGDYIFNSKQLYIIFKSNADGSVGSGFSLVFRRMTYSFSETSIDNGYCGNTLLFDVVKGALKSGTISNAEPGVNSTALGYNCDATGPSSFAAGFKTVASNNYGVALGSETIASGYNAIGIGMNCMASGNTAVALGDHDTASGLYATAMGYSTNASARGATTMGMYTKAQACGSVVIGLNNVVSGNSNIWLSQDPLFVAGNGATSAPSNALTLYKNGNLTIAGTLTQSSDLRLKKNIKQLDNSLEKITQLNGYHYHWKKDNADAKLQTGVIAQEVQKVMPELVTTNDNGDLTVNYNGITPYLIEGMKEQQHTIEEMKALIDKLSSRITQLEAEKSVGMK